MAEDRSTVSVVDDDPLIRDALRLLLKSAGYEVQTFSSAQEFLDSKPSNYGSTCLILDVRMPGLNGLELQQELTSRGYPIPIIFISGEADVATTASAMKKGAVEFLPKPYEDSDLLIAVQEAIQKASQLWIIQHERMNIQQRLDTLTPREYEILRYIIAGMLNKQIAYALSISERTVKAHLTSIFKKLNVPDRLHLAIFLKENGY